MNYTLEARVRELIPDSIGFEWLQLCMNPNRPPVTLAYRLLMDIDANQFRGCRAGVVRAMQKLATERDITESFTLEEIAASVDPFPPKIPLIPAVRYHLGGLIQEGVVIAMPLACRGRRL